MPVQASGLVISLFFSRRSPRVYPCCRAYNDGSDWARELNKLVREDPRLYTDFYALTYENFKTAFQIITNLAIPSVDKRVADRLLLEAAACPDPEGWISISQPDLAQLLAISLPTLQRVIRRLACSGLVQQGYGRIKVIDPKALQQICTN